MISLAPTPRTPKGWMRLLLSIVGWAALGFVALGWKDVIWAITTRMDPARDTLLMENTPIDYLDFASPVAGLGSKMGLNATSK